MTVNESIVEEAVLSWFADLGYAIGHGPYLAPGEPSAERAFFSDVNLSSRLRKAIYLLNPIIPNEGREEEAQRKIICLGTPSLTQTNRSIHGLLRAGVLPIPPEANL